MIEFKLQRRKFGELSDKEKFMYSGDIYAKISPLESKLTQNGVFNAIGEFTLTYIDDDMYVSPVGNVPFKDIKVTETFIHSEEPFIKVPGEIDLATSLLTGIQVKFNRNVFVLPCNMDMKVNF